MDTNALTTTNTPSVIVQVVLDAVSSPHTRRAYERALTDFIDWYEKAGHPTLSKAVVQRYTAELREKGIGPSSLNQRLTAIRKLVQEAADNGALPESTANSIRTVKGIRQEGRRSGNWLTRDEAQALLNSPDAGTLKGLRDRAILSVLIGCRLRRQEVSDLTFDHIQQREGRWVIVDLVGKRNKVRSVPMPSWAKAVIDTWTETSGVTEGRVFRHVNKSGYVVSDGLTPQAIRNLVIEYTGGDAAPHDLRRTFAKLAHKGGSGVDQIQLSLGHASIQTTERYLGVDQNLTDAPCDRLGLRLEG